MVKYKALHGFKRIILVAGLKVGWVLVPDADYGECRNKKGVFTLLPHYWFGKLALYTGKLKP
jgi:hypothetical protein